MAEAMRVRSLTVDEFFDDGEAVRAEALRQSYDGVRSPYDGVFYPGVSVGVASWVWEELRRKVEPVVGPIESSVDFARLSLAGVRAPHQAHTDLIMGDYTVIVYLSRSQDCVGGTSILEHESGMSWHPGDEGEVALWERDMNDEARWRVVGGADMRFNRMFLMDSGLYHRSEPIGGFGSGVEDGRLVLVSFLKLAAF